MNNNKLMKKNRRSRRRQDKSIVDLGPIPVSPDSVIVELIYANRVDFSLATAVPEAQIFTLNDAYDPYYTGVGAQPAGFDQWAAFYSRYRVLECEVECICDTPPSSNTNGLWAIRPSPTNGSETAILNVIVDPRSTLGESTAAQPFHYHRKFNIRELFGITASQFADEDYGALVTASPAQIMYLQVLGSTADATTSNLDAYMTIRLKYKIQFYERTNLSPSLELGMLSGLNETQIAKAKEFVKGLRNLGSKVSKN